MVGPSFNFPSHIGVLHGVLDFTSGALLVGSVEGRWRSWETLDRPSLADFTQLGNVRRLGHGAGVLEEVWTETIVPRRRPLWTGPQFGTLVLQEQRIGQSTRRTRRGYHAYVISEIAQPEGHGIDRVVIFTHCWTIPPLTLQERGGKL